MLNQTIILILCEPCSFLSDLPIFLLYTSCLFIHSFHFRYLLGVYHVQAQGYGQKYNGTFFHSQETHGLQEHPGNQTEKQHTKWEVLWNKDVQRGCVAQSGYMNSIWRLIHLTKIQDFPIYKKFWYPAHFSNIIQLIFPWVASFHDLWFHDPKLSSFIQLVFNK